MPTFTVHRAKINLSKLIEQAEAGEEIIIARGDKPAVKLVPVGGAGNLHPKRAFGAYNGDFTVPDSFFDPLPVEELAAWEGAYSTDPISVEHRAANAAAKAKDAGKTAPREKAPRKSAKT